jgi:hypothetical protein
MGRGLSDLQKRILVYAREGKNDQSRDAVWFDGMSPYGDSKAAIGERILPGKWGEWTDSDIVSVSRALRRLEARGLIVRARLYARRRTIGVILTPLGAQVAAAIVSGTAYRC